MRVVPWLRVMIAVVAVAGLALVASARPVAAHAEPDVTNPPKFGSVDHAPDQLEITFSQEVADGTTIDVLSADGISYATGPAQIDLNDPERKHVTVPLRPDMPAGIYAVKWTSISAEDGDTASGTYSFTITLGAATPSASPVGSPVATAQGTPGAITQSDVNALAEAAQKHATQQAQTTDNFDGRAYLIAVLAGVAVAIVIYLFWRIVRPKPGERVQ